ncbi:MAG: hypothetical protein AAFX76_00720 [Planctomycetota bacterium]
MTGKTEPWPADRETTQAALVLFNDAAEVQVDGRHHVLLRSLRHLEDPGLRPLFVGLSEAEHPSLRVHGRLGRAELAEPRGLSLADIAEVARDDERHELIAAALDGGLIPDEIRSALLGWSGLDAGVKLLLVTPRVAAGEFGTDSPGYVDVAAALNDAALGRQGLAALLLHELGDAQGTAVLRELAEIESAEAEAVRAVLLETAWMQGLRGAGPWAAAVAERPGVSPTVEMLARRVAIRFGAEGAESGWAEAFAGAEEVSRRTRLALTGLEVSPWMASERFDALVSSEDELIAALGRAGRAVARGRADGAAAYNGEGGHDAVLAALIDRQHARVSRWAADFAAETRSAALAAAVVERTRPGEPRGRARRMDAVARATATLVELNEAIASRGVSTALAERSGDDDAAWRRAVLLGLLRSEPAAARGAVTNLPTFDDRPTAAIALLLRARVGEADWTTRQLDALSLAVRGGAGLDDSLRIVAAWTYLKHTGQGAGAIAAVLAPAPPLGEESTPAPGPGKRP